MVSGEIPEPATRWLHETPRLIMYDKLTGKPLYDVRFADYPAAEEETLP